MKTHKSKLLKSCIIVYIIIAMLSSSIIFWTLDNAAAETEQLMEKNEKLGGMGLEMNWNLVLAQCFNASGNYYITRVSIFVMDLIPVDDFIYVQIWDNDPKNPDDPYDDEPLSSITPLEMNNGKDREFEWLDFPFSEHLIEGERYWIVAYSEGNPGEGYVWLDSESDECPEGYMAYNDGTQWVQNRNNDFLFRVYGETQNDVGVMEIIAPRTQDMYIETQVTAVIKNYGLFDQGPVDVNIAMEDPFGFEVFNDSQSIANLGSGEEFAFDWFFIPVLEGTYNVNVYAFILGDEYTKNDLKEFTIKVQAMAVLKLHDDIMVDGIPDDWEGDAGFKEDTWHTSRRELIWKDASGDDMGDGDYVYPTNSRFEEDCLDLLQFRVCIDYDNVNFLLEFGSIDDGSGDSEDGDLGFSEQIIQILVDTNRDGTGRTDSLRNARIKLDSSIGWEYAIWVDGFNNGYIEDSSGYIHSLASLNAMGNSGTNMVEISVPILGGMNPDFERWGYTVLIGAQFSGALLNPKKGSQSGFMNVDFKATSTTGGGGWDANGADPNVYDMAFAFQQNSQLNNYDNTDYDLISFTDTPPTSDAFVDGAEYWAQSFVTPATCLVTEAEIYARDIGPESTGMIISIMTNDDKGNMDPTDDTPSGTMMTSGELVDFPSDYQWGRVMFEDAAVLQKGQIYWVATQGFDPQFNGYQWGKLDGDPFLEGVAAQRLGMVWQQKTDSDMLFNVRYRQMTIIDAYRTVFFAPLVINEVSVNGTDNYEWINLYYNGTQGAPDLDMNDWLLSDQDGNEFQFTGYNLSNKENVTIYSGFGSDSPQEIYWNQLIDIWHDLGDDILLVADFTLPVDYMNYSNGDVFGEPPPNGINWGSESGEHIPRNPKAEQKLFLRYYGLENDFYNDWKISTSGAFKIKSLYLFDDSTLIENDPYDHLNTKPPEAKSVEDFDSDGNPGLTLKKSVPENDPRRFQEFNLTPVLAKDFKIVDDIELELWLDDNGTNDWEAIDVKLYDCNGNGKVEIKTVKKRFFTDDVIGWEKVRIIVPGIDYTVPEGNYLSLHILIDSDNSTSDLYLAYNTTSEPSCLRTIPTITYVNVDRAKTYDVFDVEMTDFNLKEDVIIRANISDPFGSYDIAGAEITITSPGGAGAPGEFPMTLEQTDPSNPSAWKLFKYIFSHTSEPGLYTVKIKAIESNGVVHRHTVYFTILINNPPSLSNPSLDPPSGYINEWFNFSVDYTDFDNNPPDDIMINITPYGSFPLEEVDPGDINYTDGKSYYVNLTDFDYGETYSYHFAANDSKGYWTETPESFGPQIINSPPELSNPDINFDWGNASTSFTYTVTYTDLENQAPDSITVNITGPSHAGDWVMEEVDPGDTDYSDGKDYKYSYFGFINGSYSFHFAASDSEGAWNVTSEDYRPLIINSLPILMEARVLPVWGYIDTEFNFTVTYYDLDNHPPADIYVNITGDSHSGPWAMEPVDPADTNYVDGKVYYYTWTGFTMDSYSFHCAASDIEGAWRETSEVFEPTILNSPPVLSNHNLLPTVGDPGITVFNYTVTYTDLDNQAPSRINVTIFGPSTSNTTMIALDPLDTDYTDGKDYYFTTTLPSAGTYSYRIDAQDNGTMWAVAILDSGPSVGQEQPVLSQPKVTPNTGITTTVYNFTINYTDQQNDAAGVIKLNLSGPISGNFTMFEVDPSDVTTSDGKYFYFENPSLTKGTYFFIVYGEDFKGNPTVSTRSFHPNVLNSLPQLSGGYINESQFGESWFNFTVTYIDIDNDFTSALTLNISGLGVYAMNEVDSGDTIHVDGKEYYYNITIPKGTYSYHFAARDSGLGANWRETTVEFFTLLNNIPIFATVNVLPTIGYGGDEFNFTVTILDRDNEIVSLIIYIQGEPQSPITMMDLDPLDVDTSDGKDFYFLISFPKGTYNYNFSVFDGENANETIVTILNVRNNPPVIITVDIENTNEDFYYSNDYDYSDLDGDPITWSLVTNATWLSLDSAAGEIYGTPTNIHVGSYYINISVDDGNFGVDFHNFTLYVINTLPIITTSPKEFSQEDTMHLDDFNCVDDGQGPIVYSYQTNSTWLGIDSGSGLLSGTPDNTDVGWYWINVSVDDGNGGTYSENYTLTVNNTPPSILTIPLQIALEDSTHIDDFNCDDDFQGDILYSLESNGTWFNPINMISGTISGTPTNSDVGWCWINVSVTDGNGGLDYLNYTITVFNANDPPVISTTDVTSAFEDILYMVDYEATDIDPTQDTLIWSFQTNASWLSINPTTGVLSGTPTNWDPGSYWVEVRVDDGKGGFDLTNFTLTVDDENDPPVIVSSNVYFATEDSYYEVDYEFTDIDDPTATWFLISNSSWLTIDPITGLLNGTPDNTDVGLFWINVTVDDGRGGIDFTNFTVTVNNTDPLITSLAKEFVYEDQLYIEDFDCDDDTQGNIIYSLSTNASWLAINPQTGELNGIANNTQVGWFWINITVDDGNGGFDFIYYILTVNNSLPSITTSPLTNAFEDTEYVQDFDCEDDGQGIIIYSLKTNALWLSIDPITGIVSGTPLNDDVGYYWINVTVNDGNKGFHWINYSLNAINTNDNPQIINQGIEHVNEDSPYFVDFEFSDVDLDSVTWSIDTNATWLSIDHLTGELSGTPLNFHVGIFYVNVTADDKNGGSDYIYFTITVINTNDLPTIPQLLTPSDDSGINTTFPIFTWTASSDPDLEDSVSFYILQYSTSSDFTENLTTISNITITSYTPTSALLDKTVYYWRVQSVDKNFAESGYQATHFVFSIDTGYFAPAYIGGLKSTAVKNGEVWQIDLDDFFILGSVKEGLIFTSNYDEIQIDPETHVATWKPKNEDDFLTDVTFTVSDGNYGVSSFPVDLSVQNEITIWDRIFWPYTLIPLIFFLLLAGAIMVKKWQNRPFIEEAFFISENGRLISHASVSTDDEVDEDILSGMLTGVKDLISDAFVRGEKSRDSKGLHKLEFGYSNIMLERGNHFFIALVFKGNENRAMVKRVKRAISEIEKRYGHVLHEWDGDMDSFKGADRIIQGLLSTEVLTEEEKKKIMEGEEEKEEKIIEKWSTQMRDTMDEPAGHGYEETSPQEENGEYEEEN